jgi:hypothetical protein
MAGCILVDFEKMKVINRSPAYRNKFVHRRDSVSLAGMTEAEIAQRAQLGLVTAAEEPDEDEYEDYEVGDDEDMEVYIADSGTATTTLHSNNQFDFSDHDNDTDDDDKASKRKSSVDAHDVIDHESYRRSGSGSTGSGGSLAGDYVAYSDSKRAERNKHARRLSDVGEEMEEEEEDGDDDNAENVAAANQDWEDGQWKKAKKGSSVKKKVGRWLSGK